MPPTSVGWAEAQAAVASMASRISSLIRSIAAPGAPALGVWTAGPLAAHITHVYEVDLGELTQVRVRDDAVCDPVALAWHPHPPRRPGDEAAGPAVGPPP